MDINEWLSTDIGIDIWNKKYRHKNESLDEWFERVSGGDKELKNLIRDKKFLFGGRALTNRGVENSGSMFNCYSSGYVEDDYSDIMDVNKKIGLTYKAQGGQGLSLSKIRPKGTPIGEYYQSDGIVPWMELYNTTTTVTSQGGSRKGAILISLDAFHKEIDTFITIKSSQGKIEKANLSVEIDNEFMDAVEEYYKTGKEVIITQKRIYSGHEIVYDVVPIKIYKLMCKTSYDWAEPGVIFTNRFRNYNLMQYDDEYNIVTGNPSLRRGTKVLTADFGIVNIEDLQDKTFKTFTLNNEIAPARCFLSGKNKKLYEITLDNNEKYYCTKEHKWSVLKDNKYIKVTTDNLKIGDLFPITHVKSLEYGNIGEYDDGKFFGYWYGDGSVTNVKGKNQYTFTFGLEKKEVGLLNFIINKLSKICGKEINYSTRNRGGDDWYEVSCSDVSINEYFSKYGIETKSKLFDMFYTEVSEDFRKGFIDGLFSADGCVSNYNSKEKRISLSSSKIEFLKEISGILWFYGIRNNIYSGKTELNNKIFDSYELRIGKYASNIFKESFTLSHTTKQSKINEIVYPKRENVLQKNIKIKDIKLTEIEEDVWDVHVYDDSHTFRLNYSITGNCGEQPLPKDFSCNLGSINLSEYIINSYQNNAKIDYDKLEKSIYIAIRALDQLIDENADKHPVEAHKVNSLNYRNIGLGYMGVATALFKLMVKYGTEKSFGIIGDLFYFTFRTAVFASNKLAQEKGVFPKYKEVIFDNDIIKAHFTDEEIRRLKIHGIRNCSLLSIAPNGSISTMLNVTGGCEPEFSLQYTRKTESLNDGEDKYYTIYSDPIIEYQKIHNTDEIPEFFVTAKDIKWENRISMQAVMQQHVDTAISSTVNLPKETSVEDVEELYLMAYHMGLKGVTIYVDGCKRDGILSNNTNTKDEYYSDKVPSELPRGMIYEPSNDLIGKKRKLVSGCGNLWVNAWFDPISGDMMELFLSKGSTGVCNSFMTGLSRMTSLALRAGAPVEAVLDQLNSTPTCPSYAVRTATKKDTSKGTNCTNAIGNMIVEMQKEVWAEILDDAEERDEETKPIIIKKQQNVEKKEESHKESQDKCSVCGKKMFFTMGCKSCECGFTYCG